MSDGSGQSMTGRGPVPPCPRCWANDEAVPIEVQLRLLTESDWSVEDCEFHPKPMNQAQAVAAEMLTHALARYVAAFGLSTAGPRLASMTQVLRFQAKVAKRTARILEARTDINARARARYAVGDTEGAHAIEAEPTPDYPGKRFDDEFQGGEH